jgi:hypothetical protein
MDYLEVSRNIVKGTFKADCYTSEMAMKTLIERCNEIEKLNAECCLADLSPQLFNEYLELKELIYKNQNHNDHPRS